MFCKFTQVFYNYQFRCSIIRDGVNTKHAIWNVRSFTYYFGLILWRRTRAMVRPIKGSGLRILLPLLYMSPAFSVVIQPSVHMTTMEIIVSVIFGIILSIPLIYTTGYEIREDGKIYAKRALVL